MKEIRLGMLGTGGIAQKHASALAKIPGAKLVALCNHNLEKAQQFNARNGNGARCFNRFEQMLAEAAMDALYVCMPPGAHNGEVEAAAGKGIHLFLEKPIALSLERAQSMHDAIARAGVKCQIGHHMRHSAPVQKLKAMIEDGSAGRPLFFTGRFFTHSLYSKWWRDPSIGGGQLIEQSIHLYDLARYFLGEPEIVTGFCGNLAHGQYPDYQVDDNSAATIRFRSGAIASIMASNTANPHTGSKGVTILCEKVMVEMEPSEQATFTLHGGKPAGEFWNEGKPLLQETIHNVVDCFDEISRNFIAGIREGEPLRSSITDGLQDLRLVKAVARSSAECGAPQKL